MPTNVAATPYSLGKIKKGDPKPENGVGRDTDHFRFHPIEGFHKSTEAYQDFTSVYGKAPQLIRVMAHGTEPHTVMTDWFMQYGNNMVKLMCSGEDIHAYIPNDGHRLLKPGDRGYSPPPCKLKEEGKCACKLTAFVSLYVQELWDKHYTLPVILETHSYKDVARIKFALQEAYNLAQERGLTLHRAKFLLQRQLLSVGTPLFVDKKPAPGKRTSKKMWCVTLTADPDWVAEIKQKPIIREVQSAMIPDDGPSLLESSQVRYLTREEAIELENHRKRQGWSAGACVALLQQTCNVNRWLKVPYSKVPLLVQCFNSEQMRVDWENFVQKQKESATPQQQ